MENATLAVVISPKNSVQHDNEIINFTHWFLYNIDPEDTYLNQEFVLVSVDLLAGLETLLQSKYKASAHTLPIVEALSKCQSNLTPLACGQGDQLLKIVYYENVQTLNKELIENDPKRQIYA